MPTESATDEVHILLYGHRPVYDGTGAIGGQLRDLYLRFGAQPSSKAVDMVSIALAVTAADTFVRRTQAANAWSRDLKLVLPLRSPDVWLRVLPQLKRLLAFLSGDRWSFEFSSNGEAPPPMHAIRRHQRWIDVSRTDLVTLFSGGLDSTISTISLIDQNQRPLLVSHAPQGDAAVQNQIVSGLPKKLEHVSVNAWPTSTLESEVSTRTRSFLFIAIAMLVCDVWSGVHRGHVPELRVPENGLIAINAPLTPRRIGSLSTRTTHPHYLTSLKSLFESVRLPATIRNPYELQTKGEMVALVKKNSIFRALVSQTVSCGKWKRSGRQCGYCVPCLIRRAALHTGDIDDPTQYRFPDLTKVMDYEGNRDDLISMMRAVRRLETEDLGKWVSRSGPLPIDPKYRAALIDVFRRGLLETGSFLQDNGLLV